jgi:hypothetical protein
VLARGHAGKLVAAMIAPWLIATAAHALTGRHPRLRAHPAAH